VKFDFQAAIDNIDDVPGDFRSLYEEGEEGKHVLKSDDFSKSAIAAITGLNTALKASRAEVSALKTKHKDVDLSPLSEYGDSPESIVERFNEMLAEAGKGKKSTEEIERQVSKIKADLATDYEAKLTAATQRGDTLKGQLYAHLVTSEAKSALASAGVIDVDLALPFVQNRVKVSEEDGQFKVFVVDDTGDPRYSGVTASPMSVKELVAEIKSQERFAPLFRSESRDGGGTPPDRRPKPRQGGDAGEKTAHDKIKAGIEARRRRG